MGLWAGTDRVQYHMYQRRPPLSPDPVVNKEIEPGHAVQNGCHKADEGKDIRSAAMKEEEKRRRAPPPRTGRMSALPTLLKRRNWSGPR